MDRNNNAAGRGMVLGIAVRPACRQPAVELALADLDPETGLAGDHRQRPGNRQVTVLASEGWAAALAELGSSLPWTARRANLLLEGVDLAGQMGAELLIGATVRLRITGETEPCARMDAVSPGLRAALTPGWRGGVTCRILVGGPISRGDVVMLKRGSGVSPPVVGGQGRHV